MAKLHLSPDQRLLLEQLLADYRAVLADFMFIDPTHDQKLIRQHAALHGKTEMLREILDHDMRSDLEKQRSFETLIDDQLAR